MTKHGYRGLLRTILRTEEELRRYRPRPAPPPPKPDRTDQVLDALAARFHAGDRVGLRDIRDVARVGMGQAGDIRRWARASGIWPYREGAPRAAGWADDESGGDE